MIRTLIFTSAGMTRFVKDVGAMRKKIVAALVLTKILAVPSAFLWAGESLKDNPLVLETDEQSARESLNRVSGQIDTGFASEENTYRSDNHYKPGPFGRQEISEKSRSDQPS